MTARAVLALSLLAVGPAGCAHAPPGPAPAPARGIRLSATLTSPTDIVLRWADPDRDAAGHVVEFATDPQGPYTILGFLPSSRTTFTHPDLMPKTPFYYRVRPYYGPASRVITVTVPRPGADEDAKDDYRWASPRPIHGASVARHPIRQAGAGAAPTDLHGVVVHANSIRFTWTDHANGEDGYLLEARPEGGADFGAIAVLDPDVESFGLITLPNEKTASYRVRAFYYGRPSNLAHRTTGAGPPD